MSSPPIVGNFLEVSSSLDLPSARVLLIILVVVGRAWTIIRSSNRRISKWIGRTWRCSGCRPTTVRGTQNKCSAAGERIFERPEMALRDKVLWVGESLPGMRALNT